MGVIQDDGTPWTGPGFDFGGKQDKWPSEADRKPSVAAEDLTNAITQALKRADWQALDEDGTGEFSLAGENKDEEE